MEAKISRAAFFATGLLGGLIASAMVMSLGGSPPGTFIATSGTTRDAATGWTITADLAKGQLAFEQAGDPFSPGWLLRPGWFVYLENSDRAWAFNGEDKVLVVSRRTDGNAPEVFGLARSPFPVPPAMVERIGAQHVARMTAAERAALERLGLAPGSP